jgi:peptidyl-prolyl cis-trans isomerase D
MASENKDNSAPKTVRSSVKDSSNTTILSRIRSHVGLLVGVVFVALLAFVLGDLINQGNLGGGPAQSDVGEINGVDISIAEFNNKVMEYAGDRTLTEQETQQIQEGVWQEMIDKHVYEPQYEALGLVITVDELADQMMGNQPSQYMNQYFQDRQSGMISPQFSGPDGQLSGPKIRDFVSKMTPEQETQWAAIEKDMRKFLMREKYNQLIRKGMYVTTSQAKHEYKDENTKYNFKFIVKRYSEVADSTIKVTDEELQDYYQANQYKFKQRDAQRGIEYVTFDIFPSANDIADQRKDMEEMIPAFKAAKTSKDDSLFVLSTSDDGAYMKQYLRSGTFPVGTDSAFLKAAQGDVLGPYNQGENVSIFKVVGQKTTADSVKVRHILIAYKGGASAAPDITRTKEQAKAKADSLQKAIKRGAKMEDLVEKFTDDPGSKPNGGPGTGNKGDYGWFTEESGFVQPFKDAGFNNPKGETVVTETDFGYHVIQVLDKTAPSRKVQVVAVNKKIVASETTIRGVYNKAAEFAGTNNTAEKFDAAVTKEQLNLLKAGEIQESSKYISGIENAKDVIRWMYAEDAEEGKISQPFQSGERYIVAKLSKIVEKGFKPFEDVRDVCELEVRKQKKAATFTEELNKVKGATLDVWAANAKLTAQPGANVTFAAPYVQGAGYEGEVVATMANLKPGQVSAPIKGTMGVYVVVVETVTPAEPLVDVKGQQTRLIQGISSRADGAAGDVLREEANIIDNRAKHF